MKASTIFLTLLLPLYATAFKTGLESGLICYQCVSTHPSCGLHNFDWRWRWGTTCPSPNDRCVKLIERKGTETVVTRDCLSNLEAFRVDVPADKFEGCHQASEDVKLGQFTFNSIKELDTKRNYYDNTTWCLCHFDHWCNLASTTTSNWILATLNLVLLLAFL